MRANALLAASAALVVTSGCIDFDAAENSFCNHALLEKRIGICGAPRVVATSPTGSGELWLAGNDKLTATTAPLAFVARSDASGALPLVVGFRSKDASYFSYSDVHAVDVATSAAGDALVIGTFQGSVNFLGPDDLSAGAQIDSYLVRIGRDGEGATTKQLGIPPPKPLPPGFKPVGQVVARAIAARPGQVVVAGMFSRTKIKFDPVTLTADVNPRAFLLGMDQDLGYRWHASTIGCDFASADQVTFDAAGNLYVLARAQGVGCSFGSLQPLAAEMAGVPYHVMVRYPAATATSSAEPDWAVAVSPAVGATEGCLAVSSAGILTVATPWGYDIDGRANSSQLQVRQLTALDGAPTEERILYIDADGIACRGMEVGASGKIWLAADFDSPHLATSDRPSPWEIRPGPNAIAMALSPSLSVDSLRRYQSAAGARAAGIVLAPSGETASLVGSFDGRLDVDLTGEALDASETHWSSHIFVR